MILKSASLVAVVMALSGLVAAPEPLIALAPRENFPLRAFVGVEPLPLQLEVRASDKLEVQEVLLAATLLDFDGREVARQEGKLGVGPSQTQWLGFALEPPDFGYYQAQVLALSNEGAELGRFETSLAVLRPLPTRPSDGLESVFGVNFHYDHAQGDLVTILELMRLAGIRWLRDTVYWHKVERKESVYEVPVTNRAAYQLARERYGIRTLGILCKISS